MVSLNSLTHTKQSKLKIIFHKKRPKNLFFCGILFTFRLRKIDKQFKLNEFKTNLDHHTGSDQPGL